MLPLLAVAAPAEGGAAVLVEVPVLAPVLVPEPVLVELPVELPVVEPELALVELPAPLPLPVLVLAPVLVAVLELLADGSKPAYMPWLLHSTLLSTPPKVESVPGCTLQGLPVAELLKGLEPKRALTACRSAGLLP